MSFDISELNLTAEPEAVEPESYTPPYSVNLPMDKGTYAGHLVDGGFKEGNDNFPVVFTGATSKKNGQTYLAARFAFEVTDPLIKGEKLGRSQRVYGRVDTIPERLKFEKTKAGRENANAMLDLIMAAGWTQPLRNFDDYRSAIIELVTKQAAGRARIDKQAYCNPKSNEYDGCGNTIRGEDSFTGVAEPDANGNPVITDVGIRAICPAAVHNGAGPVLLANNEIKAIYPSSKGKN